MQRPIHHVALLVPSAEKAAAALERLRLPIGPAENWESEGTREIYVGDRRFQSSLLLLMEPIQEGPYAQAMRKRGPGLHHIAIDVPDLEAFVEGLCGSGWLLHPRSLKTIRGSRTAYLARPGTPLLIEIQEREALDAQPPFIQRVEIPLNARDTRMLDALGVDQIVPSPSRDSWIHFDSGRIGIKELY